MTISQIDALLAETTRAIQKQGVRCRNSKTQRTKLDALHQIELLTQRSRHFNEAVRKHIGWDVEFAVQNLPADKVINDKGVLAQYQTLGRTVWKVG